MKLYVVTLMVALAGFAGTVSSKAPGEMLPGYSLHLDGWYRMKPVPQKPTEFPRLIQKRA